jgi:hypothetical protein
MKKNSSQGERLESIEERCNKLRADLDMLINDVQEYIKFSNKTNITINQSDKDWDKYPMTLRPKHIEGIMNRSPRKTYEFLSKSPFHVARDGSQIFISKAVFRSWIEGSK